jgi:hypothetical protein
LGWFRAIAASAPRGIKGRVERIMKERKDERDDRAIQRRG